MAEDKTPTPEQLAERKDSLIAKFRSQTDSMLLDEQANLETKMRELSEAADQRDGEDKGRFSGEEEQQWDRLNERFDDIGDLVGWRREDRDRRDREAAKAEERKSKLDKISKDREQHTGRRTQPERGERAGGSRDLGDDERQELRNAGLKRWAEHGSANLSEKEQRAMQQDVSTVGGSFVPDVEFVNRMIKFVDDILHIRGLATVIPVSNSQAIHIPSWDTDPADADWTSELNIGGEDSSSATGARELRPRPLAKFIKLSKTLIRNAAINFEDFVAERLAYKFAVSMEKAFLTGSGANQPLGLFTASSQGISTGQDISTGNTTTSIKADGLIEALYALKPQYQATGQWLFHRDAVKQIRKLKDGNGDYLWVRGLMGAPNTILERPYLQSEFAPNTFTAGLYVGIFGDFSHYWIAELMQMEMTRLVELYAATNQIGLLGRIELDGMPTLEEAFARVTLGS